MWELWFDCEWCNLTSDFIVVIEMKDLQRLVLQLMQCLFFASEDLLRAYTRIRSKQCDLDHQAIDNL